MAEGGLLAEAEANWSTNKHGAEMKEMEFI